MTAKNKRQEYLCVISSMSSSLLFEFLIHAVDVVALVCCLQKPQNIGFDIRGDVKIFDFGLSKSLDQKLKVKGGGYGYNLTKTTGR